jgi:PAP2 superfamily protein
MSRVITPAFLIGGTLLCFTTSHVVARAERPRPEDAPPHSPNPVVQWNRTLLAIVRTPKAQPATVHPTRSFAIMHAAIYDAVNAIDQEHSPYAVRVTDVPRGASPDAAAGAAAHDVLAALYPSFATALDAELQEALAKNSDRSSVDEGVRIGKAVAARLLELRRDDGSSAPPIPYTFGNNPGDYQSSPPNFPRQPQFTHWSHVAPFALPHADAFRPAPPPALTSDTYADAVTEVQGLGIAGGQASTADQGLTGRFWNGAIQNYWNEIAQTASQAHRLSTAEAARLFALLNIAIADSVIAFYDAKYTYNLWRPVTAIRAADTDDNPDTLSDPTWLPEVGNTTPDPSYPGAHAVISAAAELVLVSVLKRDRLDLNVTSEVLPGVTRTFQTLSAAADEATLSRIFAGVHFRFDLTRGAQLGRRVADFVVENFLTRHGTNGVRENGDAREHVRFAAAPLSRP